MKSTEILGLGTYNSNQNEYVYITYIILVCANMKAVD